MDTYLQTILSKLISVPSISSDREACQTIVDLVEQELAPYHLHLTKSTGSENPWLIATTQPTKEPAILLAVHLDVVAGTPERFVLREKDGKLYGRGAYDMKFAAACYLALLREHGDVIKDKDIGFLFTTDEEIGGPSISLILELGWRPKFLFLPDGGDNWHIEQQAKGMLGVQLVARGTSAHGSRPWEGDNALHRIMDVLAEVRKHFPGNDPAEATLSVNELSAGNTINQIADYARGTFDFRAFSRDDLLKCRQLVSQLATEYALEVTFIHEMDPITADLDHPQTQRFIAAASTIAGIKVGYTKSYGQTDARYFAPYGIPHLIVEPTGGKRHAADEWIDAQDMQTYYRVLVEWLTS